MPDVGQRAPKKVGILEWQSLGNICIIAGKGWSELSLYYCWIFCHQSDQSGYMFSLFYRGPFPEKAVFNLKLSSSTFLGSRMICIYIDQYNNYI